MVEAVRRCMSFRNGNKDLKENRGGEVRGSPLGGKRDTIWAGGGVGRTVDNFSEERQIGGDTLVTKTKWWSG